MIKQYKLPDNMNSKHSIVTFDGKKTSWQTWKLKFRALGVVGGFPQLFDKDFVVPILLDPSYIKYEEKNHLAHAKLVLSMKDNKDVRTVTEATTKCFPTGCFILAWKRLHDVYQPADVHSKIELTTRFMNLKLAETGEVDQWIDEMEGMKNSLEIFFSKSINDEDFRTTLFMNLPNSKAFESLQTNFSMQMDNEVDNNIPFTIDAFKRQVSAYIGDSNINLKGGQHAYAAVTGTPCGLCGKLGHIRQNCRTGSCSICGKNNHREDNCWSKITCTKCQRCGHPETHCLEDVQCTKCMKMGHRAHYCKGPGGPVTCYYCQQQGHIQNECPKKKQDEKGQTNQGNENNHMGFVANECQSAYDEKLWLGGTGASCHLTGSLYVLENIKDIETDEVIWTASGNQLKILKTGDFVVTYLNDNGKLENIMLNNIGYAPGITINLMSLTKAFRNDYHISNEGEAIVLTKKLEHGKQKRIKFGEIVKTKTGHVSAILLTSEEVYLKEIELANFGVNLPATNDIDNGLG